MNQLTINAAGGRTAFTPGEEIEVEAEWRLADRPSAVEVRLVWYTKGKGFPDVEVVATERFEGPQSFEVRRCTMRLPNGPYSFSGKLVSLIWALELVAQPSGESTRTDITVAPRGEEIILHREADSLQRP